MKKIICTLMCLTLALTLFAGCSTAKLPFTGGEGDLRFVAIGGAMILLFLMTGKNRRRPRKRGKYEAR